MQDLKKTHLFQYQKDMKQLTAPLFDSLDFNYFCYGDFSRQGLTSCIPSNPEFAHLLLNKKQGLNCDFLDHLISSNHPALYKRYNHYFLIMGNDYDNKQLASEFGIADIVLLFEPRGDHHYNVFSFGSGLDNYTAATARSRPDVLINFKYHFLSQGKALIKKAG